MEYCVEKNYTCCRHIIVDADNEEDAIRVAEELESKMSKQEILQDMDIEWFETQVSLV